MGASKVSLVGCDHGAIGDKIRAQSIKGGYGWQTLGIKAYEDMKVGTNFLADFFRGHNIEIVRYYHGRGYEEIGDVVKDEETIKRAERAGRDILKLGGLSDEEKESFYIGKIDKEGEEIEGA
ncbi:unnamed protein product [marine sediment metagenome]|uniref:Uncharacterized protein n=1 Tax=marine sediment metagenome TaxID=412755 RepID=X0W4H1_9ZZZZ